MILSDYVFYSLNDLNDGCCVFVGNYIITAGHVVSNQDLIIQIEGLTYCLSKDKALVYKWEDGQMDGTCSDIAVFRINEVTSPLTFDTTVPRIGMPLKSVSYEHVVEQTEQPDLLFGGKLSTEYFRLNECEAVITGIDGNFFQCKTEIMLRPGSSGSPVFNADKPIGILHGGQEGTNMCVFQSVDSILSLINQAIPENEK